MIRSVQTGCCQLAIQVDIHGIFTFSVLIVEYGRDVRLSSLEAVASALGLRLELVHADP